MINYRNINTISTVLLILLVYLKIQNNISIWYIIGLVSMWFALTSIGSFHIRWNYFLKSKHKQPSINETTVALTFDDGPNTKFTPKVLDLLRKYNAKATFFCVGKRVINNPEILKQILAEGHTIGNHSYNHAANNGFLSTKNILRDLKKNNQLIKEITGKEVKLFRPPFGVTNPIIAKAINLLNMQSIGWSIRSFDTISKNSSLVYKKIKLKLTNGDVILLHDNSKLTLVVLEQLLLLFEEKNTKTVTVDTLFKIKAYV